MDINQASGGATPEMNEAALRERMILPGDERYDDARAIWNGSVDQRPTAIVRCVTETDVQAAIRSARMQGLPIAVRSGGHSMAGFGTCEGGMVIDLSPMREIEIDAERKVARIEPGLTWLEVARALSAYGLALTSGDMGSVGVGGLTLGGGIGFMTRKFGLTVDHLRSARVVTADSEVVTTNAEMNPDLFWALRGGGGNFGIVTSFEFDVDTVPLVVGGLITFDGADAERIVPAAIAYLNAAPDELTAIVMVVTVPPDAPLPPPLLGKTIVAIIPCYAGAVEDGLAAVAPLQSLGEPLMAQVGPMPYASLLEMLSGMTHPGSQVHARSGLVARLDADITSDLLAALRAGAPTTMLQLRVLGGMGGTVGRDATAYAHRDLHGLIMTFAEWPPFMDAELCRAGVERVWEAARPHVRGAYVGFLGEDAQDRIHEAYPPDTYARLVGVKRRYDPQNVFRLNCNIA